MLSAFILDAILGDPMCIKHPICYIGSLISKTEKLLRKTIKNQILSGFFLVIIVCFICYSVPFFILFLLAKINFYLAVLVEIFFCFQIFAAKSLKKAAKEVYEPLLDGDIPKARTYVDYIVGRDTNELSEKGIIKATVETVAENTTDGVIAPLIFMLIGGAPLAFMYKGINTMDSMVGYKNETYILFGRCAAKLDDIANFIPARISAILMILASFICGFNGKNAFKIFRRDRYNHKSPNSAQTESVCAGALEIQLAGNASYFGELMKKPTIGDNIREISKDDIKKSVKLMYVSSVLSVILSVLILIILN